MYFRNLSHVHEGLWLRFSLFQWGLENRTYFLSWARNVLLLEFSTNIVWIITSSPPFFVWFGEYKKNTKKKVQNNIRSPKAISSNLPNLEARPPPSTLLSAASFLLFQAALITQIKFLNLFTWVFPVSPTIKFHTRRNFVFFFFYHCIASI